MYIHDDALLLYLIYLFITMMLYITESMNQLDSSNCQKRCKNLLHTQVLKIFFKHNYTIASL